MQYVAGHDNIKTTMRYVHPQANAVDKLFVRLADPDREKGFALQRQVRRVGAKSGAAVLTPQVLSGMYLLNRCAGRKW